MCLIERSGRAPAVLLCGAVLFLASAAGRPGGVAHANPAHANPVDVLPVDSRAADATPPRANAILPGPEPFSLNAYDAVQALWMIRRARLLQQRLADGALRTLAVREVRAVLVGIDPEAPTEALSRRYDLLVNGEPLDWDNSFLEYGGSMVNLRLLFTYRNQHPPPALQYRLPTDDAGSTVRSRDSRRSP